MRSSKWVRIICAVLGLFAVLLLQGCSGGSVGRIIIDTPSDSLGSIAGLVKSQSAIDLSEVLVMIREIKMTSMPDASGQFSLEKVPAGKRTIHAETAKHLSWPVTVTVQKDKVIDIGTLYLFEEPPLPPTYY
jgi:hypothetical protein